MLELDNNIAIAEASQVCSQESQLGEGPLWVGKLNRLYWVDITGQKLNYLDTVKYDVGGWSFDEPVCAVAETKDDSLLLALAKRIVTVTHSGNIIEQLCEIEADLPQNRCNDGKVDPAGRFWIGTMHNRGETGQGSLFRLNENKKLEKVLDGLSIANGLAWSNDGQMMFYIDSPTRQVWAFDFDPKDSSIRNRRTVVEIPETMGIPDGMSIDSEDNLWVAHWGDGMVRCWRPGDGQHLASIKVQDHFTTSSTFGGKDMQTLFICSATDLKSKMKPSGRLFAIKLQTTGVNSNKFKT